MTRDAVRAWYLVHKWTSLICTAFLLMLCVTGLPLIFHDEIDAGLGEAPIAEGPASSGTDVRLLPIDRLVAAAKATRPGEVPVFTAFSNDDAVVTVTTAPRSDSGAAEMTLHLFDGVTGAATGAGAAEGTGVTAFLLQLHTDMFLGLGGELFLGAMGLLFAAAIVSGVVLYAPFMRKLPFGTLRRQRSARLKWLDWHNLLGITAAAWMAVVGVTGVVNTLAVPILATWRATDLKAMTRAYAGRPALPQGDWGSVGAAVTAARAAMPGYRPQFVAYPGSGYSSPHHYAVFFQGATPLTERMLTVALVDARTIRVTDIASMPWYAKALALSQPLHFGDYGGLPLKLLWAVLDLFTIWVLGSGLYLWLGRRRAPVDLLVREVETGGLNASELAA
jgi:uncharacterized iron-regulated membrane protein